MAGLRAALRGPCVALFFILAAAFALPPSVQQQNGVTLISTLTLDRLHALRKIASRWAGPISVTVLLPKSKKPTLNAQEYEQFYGGNVSRLHVQYFTYPQSRHGAMRYPINWMRNVAIAAARTTHIFICDIDFLPSPRLWASLMGVVESPSYGTREDVAVVAPAFQYGEQQCHGRGRALYEPADSVAQFVKLGTAQKRSEAELCYARAVRNSPVDQAALRHCSAMQHCAPFCAGCYTHDSTDYSAWWRQRDTLRRITCFASDKYEPYVMVRLTPEMPRFNQSFTGYGKNKVQWTIHLQYAAYEFWVLRDEFVIHMPHPSSRDKLRWNSGDRMRVDRVYRQFMSYLREKYPTYVIPRCSRWHSDSQAHHAYWEHQQRLMERIARIRRKKHEAHRRRHSHGSHDNADGSGGGGYGDGEGSEGEDEDEDEDEERGDSNLRRERLRRGERR